MRITRDYFNKEEYPNLFDALNYAFDVVEGVIPNCVYIVGSCDRFIKDLGNQEEYYFDSYYAERCLRLVQKFEHVIGTWPTKNIVYEPWQKWVWSNALGFFRKIEKTPKYRMIHLEVPRGHGKPLCVNTDVWTPQGLKKWSEIEVGSELFDRMGDVCKVINKSDIYLNMSSVKVILCDGTEIVTSLEHNWLTTDLKELSNLEGPKESLKTTQDIMSTLKDGNVYNHTIFLPGSTNYEYNYREIVSIVPCEPTEMFCVEVDSPDNTYVVTKEKIPTHNSTMSSQFALYYVGLDTADGNFIVTAATKKDQARIILDAAMAMAKKNKKFCDKKGIKVLAHEIKRPSANSKIYALSRETKSMDGLNLRIAFLDELHAMHRATFDVITSGQSKRPDSLTICITTAGFDITGIGYDQSEYAKKVSLGEVQDDQFFAAVYTIDQGDDIYDEKTWMKANPSFGKSVDPITFRAKALKTKETPADLPNFLVKHLNVWLSETRAYFSKQVFIECADPKIKLEDFKGKQAMVGLDVAFKTDLCSFGFSFMQDKKYYIFDESFYPEESLKKQTNTLFMNCVGKGFLNKTPGEVIDEEFLFAKLLEYNQMFKIHTFNSDPWNTVSILQKAEKHRINAQSFKMNVANFSEPTKTLEQLIRQKRVVYNGSPLLSWCLGNVVVKEDVNGNIYPRRSSDKLKIDPIIAILMSLASWLQNPTTVSVYEKRGVIIL